MSSPQSDPDIVESNMHPMNPDKWTTRQLISYAKLHNPTSGLGHSAILQGQRAQLLLAVRDDLLQFYATRSDRREVAESSASVRCEDPASSGVCGNQLVHADCAEWFHASPEAILRRSANPNCVEWLRKHPSILQEIIAAGLKELSQNSLYDMYRARRLPSLESWVRFTLYPEDQQVPVSDSTSRICGKKLSKYEAIITCLECRVDSQCVICADCFRNSPCRYHKHVVTYGSGGGICDCGDPGAWNPNSFCTKHRGFQSNDDPTAGMEPVDKQWLEVEANGLVLYLVTIMQKYFQEVYLVERSTDKWSTSWIDRLLRRIVADTLHLAITAECTRRMLCIALMQKTYMSSSRRKKPAQNLEVAERAETPVFFSCLEEMFIKDIEMVQPGITIWGESLLPLLDSCIADPLFRVPFAELLLKYGESLSLGYTHVASLSVQVLTSKDVVDTLLQRLPYPYWESVLGHETILHRQLSILLFVCCHIKNVSMPQIDFDPVAIGSVRTFAHVITSSENTKALVVSRLLFRAWYKLLTMVGSTSAIQKCDSESALNERFPSARDKVMGMDVELYSLLYPIGKMVHSVCVALQSSSEPIPQWLTDALISLPPTWAKVPDPSIHCPFHCEVLDSLALQNTSVLLYGVNNTNERYSSSREYMREIFMESMHAINTILMEKRSAFMPKEFVITGVDKDHQLSYYNPQDHSATNPASFIVPHMRFLGVLIKIWERVLQQQLGQDEEKLLNSVSDRRVGEPFYALVSEVFEATHSNAEYWIDECVMPIVLLGQVEQGLWNGSIYSMNERCSCYMSLSSLYVETDIYMLQILMMLVPIERFAIQLLQRHIGDLSKPLDLWYSSFLRLILTIAMTRTTPAIVDEADLKHTLRENVLYSMLTMPESNYRVLRTPIHGLEHVLPGVDCNDIHSSILNEIAERGHGQWGERFRLKDAATWRANVNLYHPRIRDQHLYDLYDLFSRLVRREKLMRGGYVDEMPKEYVRFFPPPNPDWIEKDRENNRKQQEGTFYFSPDFRHKISLLLQTTAVLSVAIKVVHLYLFFEVKRHSRNGEDHVTFNALIHAVTVLYLAMKACKEISSMNSTGGSTEDIDWDAVNIFQQQFMPRSGYALEDLERLYPVNDIMTAITLKEKLNIPVSVHESVNHTTTIDVLLDLRTHIMGGEPDFNSLAVMLEFILCGVGALSPSSVDALASLEETRLEEENRKRQRLKEKQAALLRRVKTSDTKSFNDVQSALQRDAERDKKNNQGGPANIIPIPIPTPTNTNTNTIAENNGSDNVDSSSVVAMLLLRLAEVECCVCRDTSDDPLLLFAHTSSSDTLYRLGFNMLRTDSGDERKVRGNVHLCGHAAHKVCVAKTFGQLARYWELGASAFRVTNLCPSEFHCPICVMICTSLCPLPVLKSHVTLPVSLVNSTPSSFLFEAVRRDTLNAVMGHAPSAGILAAMRKVLARASVGLPTSSKKEEVALVEPSRLQKENQVVWEIAETLRCIRYQMYVDLEWVKAGGTVGYNELLTLLSLLVSLDAKLLEINAQLLYEEFESDSDVFFAFLLGVLLDPKEAVTFLVRHTKLLILSCFSGYYTNSQSLNDYDTCILTKPELAKDSNEYNELLIALWRELGCLTLLKVLVVDGTPVQLLRTAEEKVTVKPLEVEGITTLPGRQLAVLTMLCYLLEEKEQFLCSLKVEDPAAALASLLQTVVDGEKMAYGNALDPCKGSIIRSTMVPVPYDGPAEWRRCILRYLFHLETTVGEMILKISSLERCSVCGDTESQRVMCCNCGQRLCLRPLFSPPELYKHSLTCGNGVGIFFKGGENTFMVLFTVPGRQLSYPGIYADEFGRRDIRTFHNHALVISEEAARTWISLWMRSRWGVESSIMRRMGRTNLNRI